jgi:hypothetical protein
LELGSTALWGMCPGEVQGGRAPAGAAQRGLPALRGSPATGAPAAGVPGCGRPASRVVHGPQICAGQPGGGARVAWLHAMVGLWLGSDLLTLNEDRTTLVDWALCRRGPHTRGVCWVGVAPHQGVWGDAGETGREVGHGRARGGRTAALRSRFRVYGLSRGLRLCCPSRCSAAARRHGPEERAGAASGRELWGVHGVASPRAPVWC